VLGFSSSGKASHIRCKNSSAHFVALSFPAWPSNMQNTASANFPGTASSTNTQYASSSFVDFSWNMPFHLYDDKGCLKRKRETKERKDVSELGIQSESLFVHF
jgi:hypothetical protein